MLSPADYADDLPDLDAIRRKAVLGDADVEQTTVLPKAPVRLVDGTPVPSRTSSRRRRRAEAEASPPRRADARRPAWWSP